MSTRRDDKLIEPFALELDESDALASSHAADLAAFEPDPAELEGELAGVEAQLGRAVLPREGGS
jgi:hypothetical protein